MAKIGRPSKYKPEFCKLVDKYLKECQDEEKDIIKQENEEKGYTIYDKKLIVKLPTLEGLASYLGVNKTTLYEWAKKYPIFSTSLNKVVKEQHDRLVNKGLSNDYNSTIAKLVLSHNHGYAEKKESKEEISGSLKIISVNYAGTTDIPSPPISTENL